MSRRGHFALFDGIPANKRLIQTAALISFLLLAVLGFSITRPVKAITIRVPLDFPTIQDALNSAFPGDTIQVSSGTYVENFTIKVSISLVGADRSTTIIDGNATSHTIRVSADNVHISGFTIRNADKGVYVRRSIGTVIDTNILSNCNSSVYISYGSASTTVSNNIIGSNLQYGIRLYNTSQNVLTGNTVSNNPDGISLGSYTSSNNITYNIATGNQYGIRIYNSTGNAVEGNTLTNNNHGIYVFTNATGNAVRTNSLSSNQYGFQMIDSGNSLLRSNTISNNGINFWVYGENLTDYVQDIDTSNTVDGKPVYYWLNKQNMQVPLNAGYVAIVNSTNITVKDLTVAKNYHGVLLAYTNNSIIQNVTAQYNTYGIFLRTSASDTLSSNMMVNNTNNFGVYGTSLEHFIHNIPTSNKVNGKPVYYWINQHNLQVPPDAGYAAVVNSTNIAVKDLTLSSNYQGVLLAYSSVCTIQRVNASNNQYGLYLDYSNSNTISDNTMANNSFRGIYLYSSNASVINGNAVTSNNVGIKLHWFSSGNIIQSNTIQTNTLGMWVENASDNTIYYNSFLNNLNQAAQNQTCINRWDDGAGRGNYWSDYAGQDLNGDGVGDTLLPHLGLDYYPLMVPGTPSTSGQRGGGGSRKYVW